MRSAPIILRKTIDRFYTQKKKKKKRTYSTPMSRDRFRGRKVGIKSDLM